MRKAVLVFGAALIVGVMAGCASSPEWVRKGSGAFPGEQGKAVYGVGVAARDRNQRLQRDMARANARTELARSKEVYAAELIKDFMQKHADWFDLKAASSVEFYSQAGKQVTEATLYGSREVDTWIDDDGTLYLLMMMRLDDKFFDVAQKRYEDLIRRYKARLIKKEADQALKELDEELKKARRDPFGLTGEVFPEAE